MPRYCASIIIVLAGALAWSASRPDEIPFEKHTIDLGLSETCAFADVNGDGKRDIISGENWYEAPKWTKHKFRSIEYAKNYIDDFSDLPLDVNGDGNIDVVSCAWYARRLWWSENPGKGKGEWKLHEIDKGLPIEFAFLVDIDNDGKAQEVLPQFGGKTSPVAWYEVKNGAFAKHVVSTGAYGHGIGAGDINNDKRTDILTPKGWLEAPADPRASDWKLHPDYELESTGFMHVVDVNGDGRNDIVASQAHNYGIFWLEQKADGKFAKHMIDESWSQAHTFNMVDLNGDGRMDFLTGKRYMAHNGRDPGEREPLGVYWYESLKLPDGTVDWVRHVVDYGSRTGGGMQIATADLDGDGDLDFACGGKAGVFLFENLTKRRK